MKHKLPKGFLAGGVHCGIKKKRKDLSLFYSAVPSKCAAVFTTNLSKAAPVILSEKKLKRNKYAQAVIVNSGNANCMTGSRGFKDAIKMTNAVSTVLSIPEEMVHVSSTGVIGEKLPIKSIIKGIPKLVAGLSPEGLIEAADGIMTTDRFHKVASRTFSIGEKKVTITGIAKGAGMINPNMATMLAYILTDANIATSALKMALSESTDLSFNAITVDGDMSTNDTVMLLANGKAENSLIKEASSSFTRFQINLDIVAKTLATMIIKDGEGASKFIEVHVKGAKTKSDAKKVADAIANSLLVKCAVHGGDPNWGRVASSVGASGIAIDPSKMEIKLDGIVFFRKGKSASPRGRRAVKVFKKKDVIIEVNLHSGKAEAVMYTCDISKRYITINSYYTT